MPEAIMNGVICERLHPDAYGSGQITIPPQFRSKLEYNQWVRVVSVGPNCKEDIRPGDKVYIGVNMGTRFWVNRKEYVLIWDKDPLARDRN
jgi:co-chaperonin GroES (HSP10)